MTERAELRTSLLEEAEGEGLNPTANQTMGEIIATSTNRRSARPPIVWAEFLHDMARPIEGVPMATPGTRDFRNPPQPRPGD